VFHVDVGDGRFIEEITMGPIVIQSLAPIVHARGGVFDCHLMIQHPDRQLEQLKAAGADSVTFHVEAVKDSSRLVALARDLDLGVGVAFTPETSVGRAATAGEGADFVLCMSIHPGLSGQTFMPEALGRIEALRGLLPDGVAVQVDGGVHMDVIRSARDAGANLLVAGSAVFWADDPAASLRALVAAAHERDVGVA
jgi:ribulose-phosphate 3-epimerase